MKERRTCPDGRAALRLIEACNQWADDAVRRLAELRKEAADMADKIDYDGGPESAMMLSVLYGIRESLAVVAEELVDGASLVEAER